MGVGLVIFWQILLFTKGKRREHGWVSQIETARWTRVDQKRCGIKFQRATLPLT
jgi:hypothetical protein